MRWYVADFDGSDANMRLKDWPSSGQSPARK